MDTVWVNPEMIRVDNMGVGLADATNQRLALGTHQYLVVGEQSQMLPGGSSQQAFQLMVDHQGVAIASTLEERKETEAESYALYVNGDVRVRGRLVASAITDPDSSNAASAWAQEQNNLYYGGRVTVGSQRFARCNLHSLQLAQVADAKIDHAQMAVDNTQGARLRLGVLGTNVVSPAVINTSKGTALEFHVGREQAYFDPLYVTSNFPPMFDPLTGITSSQELQILSAQTPQYAQRPSKDAPHLRIDADGRVGIRTHAVEPMSFAVRGSSTARPQEVVYTAVTEAPALHVHGTVFGCNLLIWDYESNQARNIDEMYARRLEVTVPSQRIAPGTFAVGDYAFPSRVGIGGAPPPPLGANHQDTALQVTGSAAVTHDLWVEGTTVSEHVRATGVEVDSASFCNDTYFNKDLIINQSIRLRGQMFVEVLKDVEADGTSNFAWRMIQFTPADPALPNFNLHGQGASTPGRFGVGVDVERDKVEHPLVVVKRDPGQDVFKNMFEMQLLEKSTALTTRAAWIGHPKPAGNLHRDGSLVFATPASNDPLYAGIFQDQLGYVQNMYFYPGADLTPSAPTLLDASNAPTLAVCHRCVGINTFRPATALDVTGSIRFSQDLIFLDEKTDTSMKLGMWKSVEVDQVDISVSPAQVRSIKGIVYDEPNYAFVGIGAAPDARYKVKVAGVLRADAFVTQNDRVVGIWNSTEDRLPSEAAPVHPPHGVYTWASVGVGVPQARGTLELKDNYGSSNGTSLVLTASELGNPHMRLTFSGIQADWCVHAWEQNYQPLLECAHAVHLEGGALSNTARAWIARYNTDLETYQMVVGGNETCWQPGASNPAPSAALTVGGDLAVLGDVSITGQFKVMARPVASSNVLPQNLPQDMSDDDVFLGGNRIWLQPAAGEGVHIGQYLLHSDDPTTSLFSVYQDDASRDVLAHFQTAGSRGFIELQAAGNRALRFGLTQDPLRPFGFFDGTNRAYMSFYEPSIGDRCVSFNHNLPTAVLHAQTDGYGCNLCRLTKRVTGAESTTGAAPELELEKTTNTVFGSTQAWTLHGPDGSYEEKLSFLYSDFNVKRKEVLCITRDGHVGVGVTNPSFALDIGGTGTDPSLRLWSKDSAVAMPQLLFQTGSQVFGGDASYDFRMYSSNDRFWFDMQKLGQSYLPIWQVEDGHVGIRGPATPAFDTTLHGSVNVLGTLTMNGATIESTRNGNNLILSGSNVFMMADTQGRGGITLHRALATSNSFHVFSGSNANLMVLDSTFEEAQVHFRVQQNQNSGTYHMYRMGMSNTRFGLHFQEDCGNAYYVPADDASYSPVWTAEKRAGQFAVDMHGALTTYGGVHVFPSSLGEGMAALEVSTVGTCNLADFHGNQRDVWIDAAGNLGVGFPPTSGAGSPFSVQADTTFTPVARFEQIGPGNLAEFIPNDPALPAIIVDANSRLGIQVQPAAPLHVHGDTLLEGNAHVTGNMRVVGIFENDLATTSDRKIKQDVATIPDALEKVQALHGYTFTRTLDNKRSTGMLADEVLAVLPEAVRDNGEYLGVCYGNMVGLLVEAIKELRREVQDLRDRLPPA